MRFIERSNRVKPNKNPITNIRSTSARAGGKRVRLLEKVTGVGRLLHGHCHYRRQEKSRPRSTRSDHLRTMSRPPGVRLAGAVGRGVANGAREIAASRCDNSPIENQAKKKQTKQTKRRKKDPRRTCGSVATLSGPRGPSLIEPTDRYGTPSGFEMIY